MILTTTNTIEAHKIHDYLGVVTGVAVNRKQTGMTFSLKKYYDSLENNLEEVKESAFQNLKKNAIALKANAVVGITVDVETIATSGIIMVSITGTAVKVA
ncbi:YbjQ family protein [Lacinutrix sp. C3R15]|uniref:YbjQ family protein n=1 Tax=Flavobacteriaceae TaxID=49546 RepID=UPI001C09CA39|nr:MULTISPECIES: heavy metal-binding domain-containing protein [Flavobacteriaceae]MBU2938013.1 YbjQ family protein [Lacinutrix sp. C3R15]MDO6621327.1 heavy metal-binding domain-containing protein [Oceanihabitans sp. 1_MG-2023]